MSKVARIGRSGVPGLLVGAGLTISCVHYEAKPIAPRQPLTTIEARTTDDGRLRSFLSQHGAVTTEPVRWDLRALTLVAFYYHPGLDEARAAADVARGAIV